MDKPDGQVVGRGKRLLDIVFDQKTTFNALIVFNLVFLVQTSSDLFYLWGGQALPDGMSYAYYAHRGAYPLVATALLAIAIILIVLRDGGEGEKSRTVKCLVYLWIAQNALLVVSSLYRLNLYVAEYSLTGLRLAAGIWMCMIIFGLVTIIVRIAKKKGNSWLMHKNWLLVFVVFYLSALVDYEAVIANYNVEHSYEASGSGQQLDVDYLMSFGPSAIPAVEKFIDLKSVKFTPKRKLLVVKLSRLKNAVASSCDDWRCWHLRLSRQENTLAFGETN